MELDDTANSATDAQADAVETAVDAVPVDTSAAESAPDAGDDADESALGGKAKEPEAADPEEPGTPVVPEAYDLTAPEGMAIDPALLEEATPIFREIGLSNEAANKVLPLAQSLMTKSHEAAVQSMIDAGAQQRKAWLDEAKADPEIGGGKWDATLHSAAKALDALGYPEGSPFRAALTETGFGNHPEMIRAMAKVGAMVGEDGDFIRSDAGVKVEETREQRWYGSKE
ncbi:hypothetical protein [Sphingobium sp. TCM1]|uniref:hypothetical protein n=1 Tax=Sphingobium sp. TCM1 TaxID=453246 RepID=UPI0007F40827|nr:hypothetical protein [Sphingobium sp. TCM1]OAN56931.1 hypothetical protein A7Q26_17700 [Sphingobium sp. TCM1]